VVSNSVSSTWPMITLAAMVPIQISRNEKAGSWRASGCCVYQFTAHSARRDGGLQR
jgi:hypothetical protein